MTGIATPPTITLAHGLDLLAIAHSNAGSQDWAAAAQNEASSAQARVRPGRWVQPDAHFPRAYIERKGWLRGVVIAVSVMGAAAAV